MVYGWHLGRAGRICKLIDLRYYELDALYDVEHEEDGSRHDYVRERTWFVDEYGTKQAFDLEYIHSYEEWSFKGRLFMPYYQCDSCLIFLRSWEEARLHVGDDEDVDEPVLRMINNYHRGSKK